MGGLREPQEREPSGEDAWAERVAGDLHDGVVQWLVGAKMQAEAIRANFREGRPVSQQALDALVDSLQSGLAESRRLLRGLHGPDISDGLWHDALRGDLAQAEDALGFGTGRWDTQEDQRGGPRMEIALDRDTEPLPETTAVAAYRLLAKRLGMPCVMRRRARSGSRRGVTATR